MTERLDPDTDADAGIGPEGLSAWTVPVRLALARAALLWERAWPELWPAVGVLGLFVAVAWLNLLPQLPAAGHLGVLALFTLVFFHLLGRGLSRISWPRRRDGLRRLERDSGLTHRPLQALEDRPATAADHPLSMGLWQRHRATAQAALGRLRTRLPRPYLASRDTRALRALVFLVLVVTGIGAWGEWGERLALAMQPRLPALTPAAEMQLEVWIDPPDYTGRPPLFLSSRNRENEARADPGALAAGGRPDWMSPKAKDGAPTSPGTEASLAVPEGSRLLARVTGSASSLGAEEWAPMLSLPDGAQPFRRIDGRNYEIEADLQRSGRVHITRAGETLGAWSLEVVRDQPPEIALMEPPSVTPRSSMRLAYQASDDYGVTALQARLRLAAEAPPALVDDPPLVLTLPTPGDGRSVKGVSYHDLTSHPWAGQPVRMTLIAEDGAGQSGRSETVFFMVPERVFEHPVARAIIAERRRLLSYGLPVRTDVAGALSRISAGPDRFHHDIVVFLALRVSVARLSGESVAPDALSEVAALLWETALRLDDGGVTLAERAVREAGKALAEALDHGADPAEVKRLMAELQEALDRYMQALAEQMQRAMEEGGPIPEMPEGMAMEQVDRRDLDTLMQQMQELAETGAYDSARQMLSQLESFLETLQTGPLQLPGQNQAWSLLEDLQAVAREQERLLQDAFGQGRQMEQDAARARGEPVPGESGERWTPGESMQTGREQHALRLQLGEVMRRSSELLDEIPEPLGEAEQAMRQAERALQLGMPQAAVPAQSEALEHLHQGLESFAQQLAERMAAFNPGLSGQPQPGRMGRDPLGRPLPGAGRLDDSNVEIPDRGTVQRAREVLEELRRRAGESDRPPEERDYIRRLLDLF